MTKDEALKKIEELKKYVAEEDKKEASYKILNKDGEVIYTSTKTNLRDAVIEAVDGGANLWEADLKGANLKGADLRGANLWEADLRGANLRGANLWEADLKGADLLGANLKGADLRGAELHKAIFYGKGGTSKLKQNQVTDFLNALGFQVEE